ncbi:MAG TPA: DNA translocase FtsK, partial [Clostridia bacterium]|nr:DNA translocase FtsK [Clostridia bacterium]
VIINQNGNEIAVFDGVSEQVGRLPEKSPPRRSKRKTQNKHIEDLQPPEREKMDVGMEVGVLNENSDYKLPPITILDKAVHKGKKANRDISDNIKVLEETLRSFGINARVIQVSRGPAITRYEIQPPAGVKVSRIVALADDIALGMAAQDVRIEAPIPGKAAVGIEVPNKEISMVHLRELLETKEFKTARSHLAMALGKDIAGNPIIADLSRMPHLLIAGATGSGKSVCLNTLIASVLFKSTPSEVKLLIIDPKMVELTAYNGIPHLISPVVTNPKKAATSLRWAVKEMERRYAQFAEAGVRDIFRYNNQYKKSGKDMDQGKMPLIIVIIDELADLMMVAPADVEDAICRLAQMARAAGIHLLVATQRPSVDVITGLIKANIPSRISFAVSSQSDSRTILDMGGAEKLLGKGDMLYYPVGASKPIRVQGAFLSDKEVEGLVDYLKGQDEPEYDEQVLKADSKTRSVIDEDDELLPKAVETLIQTGHASISMLQRRLRIGYARAARLIDIMERNGIVGGYEGSKPRAILMTMEEYKDKFGKK